MRLDLNLLRQKSIPLHLAVNLSDFDETASEIGLQLLQDMLKTGFPILSLNFNVSDASSAKTFFESLQHSSIFEEQVRVFVIGDWYKLDHKLVEKIKFLTDKTKDFDKHFLNLLINYDGKKEIFGVINLLAKKMSLGQISSEDINEQLIKDNIFNSYFTPPELIVEVNGKYSGMLLWDSVGSKIFYTKKNKTLFKEALDFYQS